MDDRLKIVIADDHPLYRSGLRNAIEKEERYVVVAEAGDGRAALEYVREFTPAIVVLDLEMPVMNGLDAAKQILIEKRPSAIIILTMYDDEEMFNEAMDIGVLGYLLKDSASVDIVRSIAAVARGDHFVSPAMSAIALKQRTPGSGVLNVHTGVLLLTPAERRVLSLVVDNKTSAEIADVLCVSVRTVENHRTKICSKLGISGNNALLHYALTHRNMM